MLGNVTGFFGLILVVFSFSPSALLPDKTARKCPKHDEQRSYSVGFRGTYLCGINAKQNIVFPQTIKSVDATYDSIFIVRVLNCNRASLIEAILWNFSSLSGRVYFVNASCTRSLFKQIKLAVFFKQILKI